MPCEGAIVFRDLVGKLEVLNVECEPPAFAQCPDLAKGCSFRNNEMDYFSRSRRASLTVS
jgi:hypothetical protein